LDPVTGEPWRASVSDGDGFRDLTGEEAKEVVLRNRAADGGDAPEPTPSGVDGESEEELVESIEESLEEGAAELEEQAELAETQPIDPADLPGGENTATDADEE